MDLATQRKIVAILKALQQNGQPMGSTAISRQLGQWGIDLRERMIRYYLSLTDAEGLTRNLHRRGRILTDKGRNELDIGIAIDKVGFVASRIDDLAYRMNFDETRLTGSLILNISLIKAELIPLARKEIAAVMKAKLGMGRFVLLAYPQRPFEQIDVPKDHIAVGTVCSVTLNGVLLRHGINMISRFGGLLEFYQHTPVRFRQFINYDGSTLDPLEIFIKGKMTSVRQVVLTGTGTVGASFREVPVATLPQVETIVERLDQIGLGGVLLIGKPNQPLLDIPVSPGRVGIIVAGGLNPIAALEEVGIPTRNYALHSLQDFHSLQTLESL